MPGRKRNTVEADEVATNPVVRYIKLNQLIFLWLMQGHGQASDEEQQVRAMQYPNQLHNLSCCAHCSFLWALETSAVLVPRTDWHLTQQTSLGSGCVVILGFSPNSPCGIMLFFLYPGIHIGNMGRVCCRRQ